MSGNILSDSLYFKAKTRLDSMDVMTKWAKSVDEKSLKPYVKDNFQGFLTVRGPTEVFNKLAHAQNKENAERMGSASTFFNASILGGFLAIVAGVNVKPKAFKYGLIALGGLAVVSGIGNLIYNFFKQRNDVSNSVYVPRTMDGI